MGNIKIGTIPLDAAFVGDTEIECVRRGDDLVWCSNNLITYTGPPAPNWFNYRNAFVHPMGAFTEVAGTAPVVYEIIGNHPSWMSVNADGAIVGNWSPLNYAAYEVSVRATKGSSVVESPKTLIGNITPAWSWRLYITDNQSGHEIYIQEMHYYNEAQRWDRGDYNSITASSHAPLYPPAQAFDHNATWGWRSVGGDNAFIDVYSSQPARRVGKFTIKAGGIASNFNKNAPLTFQLQMKESGRWYTNGRWTCGPWGPNEERTFYVGQTGYV